MRNTPPSRFARRPTVGRRALAALALATMSIPAAACAGGGLGEILTGGQGTGGPAQPSTLTVEIQEVRDQRQEIVVRTQDGQQGAVLFDANTQVIYQNEQYAVQNLEAGDVVDMRVQEVQQGLYTDLIQVRTPVQERQGAGAGTGAGTETGLYQVEGTIGEIDLDQWMFTLDMTQGGTVPIYLPSNARATDRERLRDYRPGDYVRVEIRALDDERAQLVRFGWS